MEICCPDAEGAFVSQYFPLLREFVSNVVFEPTLFWDFICNHMPDNRRHIIKLLAPYNCDRRHIWCKKLLPTRFELERVGWKQRWNI